ncbi:hypothetical protein BC629DRAFT_1442237 [Irpex lacteus]|nr:hypothetical protein BC629DRAFT_1442237 [Irpex lacteus]
MASVAELQQEYVSSTFEDHVLSVNDIIRLIETYILTAASVAFFYECVITLCEEVDIVWRRKWTTMTWIYALTRYSVLFNNIRVFPTYDNNIEVHALRPIYRYRVPENCYSCKANIYMQGALTLIQYSCLALFSAFRVYALSDGRCIMAGLVFLLNMVPFATNMSAFLCIRRSAQASSRDQQASDYRACTYTASGSVAWVDFCAVSLISRISVIIGDILVLVVTWTKTAESYREVRRLKMKAPIAAMLIRDVRSVLLVINVLEVFGANVPILFSSNIIEPFFQILPPIIVCRFFLNLRQVKPAGNSWVSGNQSHSLRFVGNMGESLQFGEDEERDDGLEEDGGHNAVGHKDSSELAIEASNSGEANEGQARGHSDFGSKR